jgi:hypothetical protein
VRVPSEAGKGKAKVTLSFPDWKDAEVAPATYEVPVIDPEPKAVSTAESAASRK